MTGFNNVAFEVHQRYMAWGYMLKVILLKNINFPWFGAYTRYTLWYILDIPQ